MPKRTPKTPPTTTPKARTTPKATKTSPAPRRPIGHWLFKSEPSVFSIQHLAAAKGRTTFWDGVRNYQARNLLRDEVKAGDLVLFYHSNAESTGVAGVAEVMREAYPDPTQFDATSDHFDPRSTRENPPWLVVDVRHVQTFASVVTLDALTSATALAAMDVLRRGNRLSIQRVRPDEFAEVLRMAGN
ncbi:MAG: EVE domain-containing protein [Planctomycetes bacterium]|nr:EVE domain-containing protein [Planctomycetota bacterium]